jgi:DNA topoisomerase-1
MNRHLVIVESGTKAKTIEKYLNSISKDIDFKVVASNGHICELVKEKNGYGLEADTFLPKYELCKDKSQVIKRLKQESQQADTIWLAADNDREGEAIAWHVKNVLKAKKYKRIVFNEITKDAIEYAINHPKDIDMNMVNSQQARRVLDRIIGFSLTKQLMRNFTSSAVLSAGRVQSVVLMMICEKQEKIKNHQPEEYWNVLGSFDIGVIDAKLYLDSSIHKYKSKDDVEKLFKHICDGRYILDTSNSQVKRVKETPDPPFTTSTLQQRAYSELGFSIKKTMKVAQELYEQGHISYMRTDSTALSKQIVDQIHTFIAKTYNIDYINENTSKTSMNKQKNAQLAHEAIRPTKIQHIEKLTTSEQKSLYMLILKRTVASQMKPALFDELSVRITHPRFIKKNMYFLGKTKALVFQGYKIVYDVAIDKVNLNEKLSKLKSKNVPIYSTKLVGNHVWTTPPQRYNESTLIKKMEDTGIGRPSTYVSILNKLYERTYISKQDLLGPITTYTDVICNKDGVLSYESHKKELYNEKSKLVASDAGIRVNTFLQTHHSDVVNLLFTTNMEADLDKIASADKTYVELVRAFIQFIEKTCLRNIASDRVVLNGFTKEFSLNGLKYIVRNAKYGPVIECKDPKKFYTLKPFLQHTKRTIESITHEDIDLIISMPVVIENRYTIRYGRYGFYVEDTVSKKTLNVFPKYYPTLLSGDYVFVKSMFQPKKSD